MILPSDETELSTKDNPANFERKLGFKGKSLSTKESFTGKIGVTIGDLDKYKKDSLINIWKDANAYYSSGEEWTEEDAEFFDELAVRINTATEEGIGTVSGPAVSMIANNHDDDKEKVMVMTNESDKGEFNYKNNEDETAIKDEGLNGDDGLGFGQHNESLEHVLLNETYIQDQFGVFYRPVYVGENYKEHKSDLVFEGKLYTNEGVGNCPFCKGAGKVTVEKLGLKDCPDCDGTGDVQGEQQMPPQEEIPPQEVPVENKLLKHPDDKIDFKELSKEHYDKDGTYWFTTDNGKKIGVKKGQSLEDALGDSGIPDDGVDQSDVTAEDMAKNEDTDKPKKDKPKEDKKSDDKKKLDNYLLHDDDELSGIVDNDDYDDDSKKTAKDALRDRNERKELNDPDTLPERIKQIEDDQEQRNKEFVAKLSDEELFGWDEKYSKSKSIDDEILQRLKQDPEFQKFSDGGTLDDPVEGTAQSQWDNSGTNENGRIMKELGIKGSDRKNWEQLKPEQQEQIAKNMFMDKSTDEEKRRRSDDYEVKKSGKELVDQINGKGKVKWNTLDGLRYSSLLEFRSEYRTLDEFSNRDQTNLFRRLDKLLTTKGIQKVFREITGIEIYNNGYGLENGGWSKLDDVDKIKLLDFNDSLTKRSKESKASESNVSYSKCPNCKFETAWKEGDDWQKQDAEREMSEHKIEVHNIYESLNTVCPECGSKNTSRQQTKFGGGQAPERFDCKKCGNVFKPKSTESCGCKTKAFEASISKYEKFIKTEINVLKTRAKAGEAVGLMYGLPTVRKDGKKIKGTLAYAGVSLNDRIYLPEELAKGHGKTLPLLLNHSSTAGAEEEMDRLDGEMRDHLENEKDYEVGEVTLTWDADKLTLFYEGVIENEFFQKEVDEMDMAVSLGIFYDSDSPKVCDEECYTLIKGAEFREVSLVYHAGFPIATIEAVESRLKRASIKDIKAKANEDSLVKIEDNEDADTQVTVLDEWKNETDPDVNGETKGIRTTKAIEKTELSKDEIEVGKLPEMNKFYEELDEEEDEMPLGGSVNAEPKETDTVEQPIIVESVRSQSDFSVRGVSGMTISNTNGVEKYSFDPTQNYETNTVHFSVTEQGGTIFGEEIQMQPKMATPDELTKEIESHPDVVFTDPNEDLLKKN